MGPASQGEACLTRFADDFVVNFQYRRDAEEFRKNLKDRFGEFGLELAEEMARLVPCQLEDSLPVVLKVQGANRFERRNCDLSAAPLRAAFYPLVDANCNLPPHAVPGSPILNSRQTLQNNRHLERRSAVPKLHKGRMRYVKSFEINRMGIYGSATGNRTRVLRLRISRPNP